jgi:transcriptional regulator with XRE-family HTH domain
MDVARCFGQNLARLRKQAGQTQEELAHRAGLHRTVVSLLETGKREAQTTTIVKLAGALEVGAGELFEGMSWVPPKISTGGFQFKAE